MQMGASSPRAPHLLGVRGGGARTSARGAPLPDGRWSKSIKIAIRGEDQRSGARGGVRMK